jgi:hypothetical protein
LLIVVADNTNFICDAINLTNSALKDNILEFETCQVEVAIISNCYSCAKLSIVVALYIATPH